VTEEGSDRPDVILHFFGECERATHEPRDSLPECVVEPLDVVGLAGVFGDRLRPARRRRGQGSGPELEPTKTQRARANLAAAGWAALVDSRVGDALDTLKAGIDGEVDGAP
jgi:hypothetical protein